MAPDELDGKRLTEFELSVCKRLCAHTEPALAAELAAELGLSDGHRTGAVLRRCAGRRARGCARL